MSRRSSQSRTFSRSRKLSGKPENFLHFCQIHAVALCLFFGNFIFILTNLKSNYEISCQVQTKPPKGLPVMPEVDNPLADWSAAGMAAIRPNHSLNFFKVRAKPFSGFKIDR
jgi:hypothetical protein